MLDPKLEKSMDESGFLNETSGQEGTDHQGRINDEFLLRVHGQSPVALGPLLALDISKPRARQAGVYMGSFWGEEISIIFAIRMF